MTIRLIFVEYTLCWTQILLHCIQYIVYCIFVPITIVALYRPFYRINWKTLTYRQFDDKTFSTRVTPVRTRAHTHTRTHEVREACVKLKPVANILFYHSLLFFVRNKYVFVVLFNGKIAYIITLHLYRYCAMIHGFYEFL